MHPRRVYIEMLVNYSVEGAMRPVKFKWEDGQSFEIDRVLDVRRAASGAGSSGLRYTVKIMGQIRYIFYEDVYSDTGRPRWFVESEKEAKNQFTGYPLTRSNPELPEL